MWPLIVQTIKAFDFFPMQNIFAQWMIIIEIIIKKEENTKLYLYFKKMIIIEKEKEKKI